MLGGQVGWGQYAKAKRCREDAIDSLLIPTASPHPLEIRRWKVKTKEKIAKIVSGSRCEVCNGCGAAIITDNPDDVTDRILALITESQGELPILSDEEIQNIIDDADCRAEVCFTTSQKASKPLGWARKLIDISFKAGSQAGQREVIE